MSSFVNNYSQKFIKSELDVFSPRPVQSSIESYYTAEFRPVSVVESEILEFYLPPTDEYTMMSTAQLYLKVKIVDNENKPIENKTKALLAGAEEADFPDFQNFDGLNILPVNNFMDSLFSHVGVTLSGTSITQPNNHYHYKSYFEKLLNFSEEVKRTHLGSCLFYPDTAGGMENARSRGYRERGRFINKGQIELRGFIHHEMSGCNRALISNTPVNFRFHKNKPEFSLLASEDTTKTFKILITEAKLLVRRLKVSPATFTSHELILRESAARYPITRSEIRQFTLGKDCKTNSIENAYLGVLPKRLFIAMVPESSTLNLKKCPYNFEHMNLDTIKLSSDSHPNIRPIVTNFKTGQFVDAYSSLVEASNIHFHDQSNGISMNEYAQGNTVIGFDLTADASGSADHASYPRSGTLRIELQFTEPLAEAVCVICYAEYDSHINVDKNRSVLTDFSC